MTCSGLILLPATRLTFPREAGHHPWDLEVSGFQLCCRRAAPTSTDFTASPDVDMRPRPEGAGSRMTLFMALGAPRGMTTLLKIASRCSCAVVSGTHDLLWVNLRPYVCKAG